MRLLLTDLGASLSLLSRLPVPVDHATSAARSAQAAWAWPLAGAFLAILASIPGMTLAILGTPTPLAAGLSLLVLVMITGAMHEDGLADSADGLWGGWEPEQRLEIMKDSRVGVYGVLALVIVTGLRWFGFVALLAAGPLLFLVGMIAAAALSRAAMAGVMYALPPARTDGLAANVGAVPAQSAGGAVAIAVGLSLVAGIVPGLAAVLFVGAVAILVAQVARKKIGGQTGDILGATQQVSEVAALAALSTLLL